MAKCKRCGRSLMLGGIRLADAVICKACLDELGFSDRISRTTASIYKWDDVKDGIKAYYDRLNAKNAAQYMFNVQWEDPAVEDVLEKYQKSWTDREDRYEGMTKKDVRETCVPGEKVFKYPPLDVDVELRPDQIDSKPAILVYLIDGKDPRLIGHAPKTKAKKIIELLRDPNLRISAELSGGDFWEVVCFPDGGEAVCESNIPKPLKVQVHLEWDPE